MFSPTSPNSKSKAYIYIIPTWCLHPQCCFLICAVLPLPCPVDRPQTGQLLLNVLPSVCVCVCVFILLINDLLSLRAPMVLLCASID